MKRTYPSFITSIVPVYNVRPYLADTIESIVNQSIGFRDNVHLILVDDGSTDGSGEICKEYVKQYPDNIEYIHQENAGVSAARNNGFKHANGKYIHFLDSDDIISKNYYDEGVTFLDAHVDEIDFVAAKIQFFDASIDAHPNNYKFTERRVIDVDQDPDNVVMHVSSCLFLRESLEGKHFDTALKIAEDAKFVTDVLEKRRKYGVLKDSSLYYRKRSDGSSAINGQYKNRSFYTETPYRFLEYLLDSWSQNKGSSRYAECVVIYDLHWRLRQQSQTVLTPGEEQQYKRQVDSLIARISDDLIVSKRGISVMEKRFLLSRKYGDSWRERVNSRHGSYQVNGVQLFHPKQSIAYVDFISRVGANEWKIEGYATPGRIHTDDRLQLIVDGEPYDLAWTNRKSREVTFLGEVIDDGGAFDGVFKLPSSVKPVTVSVNYVTFTGEAVEIPIQTNRFTGMSVLPWSFKVEGEVIFRKSRGKVLVYKNSSLRIMRFDALYCMVIAANWRLNTLKSRLGKLRRYNLKFLTLKQRVIELIKPFAFSVEAVAMIPRALLLRAMYRIVRPHVKRPIWLISDRGAAAGDNGEALYRYIQSRESISAKVYFVISKKSSDFYRVKRDIGGRVVNQDSLYYKLLFLLSSKVISSQADIETTNPFIRQIDHYVDLFNFDFVFLQHGVIRYDLSDWLNRFEKNIKLFITSAEKEYQSILDLPYYYSKDVALLSGLPRYDYLESSPKGRLILAPTYRKNLARMKTDKNGVRRYDPLFKKTAYRNFYNNLMNDMRIIRTLKEKGMTGELYLHPAFEAQIKDFEGNKLFKVKDFPYNYKEAFKEGNLLVSDHSSVVFDFAYLNKPVVYSQFDIDTFFEGHSYDSSDFFVDERDGFGPVTHTYEDLVSEIIKNLEGGCVLSSEYQERVDRFFYRRDQNNSRRVYEAILSLEK